MMGIFKGNRCLFSSFRMVILLMFIGGCSAQRNLQHKTDQYITLNFALRGKKSNANVIRALNDIHKVEQCITQCMSFYQCRSVNYNQRMEVCQLLEQNINDSQIETSTTEDPDWNFYGYRREERDFFKCIKHDDINKCCFVNGVVCTLAKSCLELKSNCPACESGFYRINLNSENIDVYCDMQQDSGGGGWIMIANVSVYSEGDRFNKYIDKVRNHNLNEIQNVKYGAFALSEDTLSTIRMKFTEIRFKCSKPYHNRKIDVVMKNAQIIDGVLLNKTSEGAYSICKNDDYYLLPGDNSNIGAEVCTVTGLNNYKKPKLYDHGYFRYSEQHFHIHKPDRMDCDDFTREEQKSYIGYWQVFIR